MGSVVILSAFFVLFAEIMQSTASCVDGPDFNKDAMLASLKVAPKVDLNTEVPTIPARYNQTLRLRYGSPQCPTEDSLTYRLVWSGCHFHYLLNIDMNRVPKYVVEKRCSCADDPNRKEDCVTTKNKRHVYRRVDCKEGLYVYKMTVEEFDEDCNQRLHGQESPKSPDGQIAHDTPKSPAVPIKPESPKSPALPIKPESPKSPAKPSWSHEDSPKSPL